MKALLTWLSPAPTALTLALLVWGGVAAGTASAQCVGELNNGDVLVSDRAANQIYRLDDVSLDADPDDNQQRLCVGTDFWKALVGYQPNQPPTAKLEHISSPRFMTNDRSGRLWVSTGDRILRVDPTVSYHGFYPPGSQVPLRHQWWLRPNNDDPEEVRGIATEPNGHVVFATKGFLTPYHPGTGQYNTSSWLHALRFSGDWGIGDPSGLIRDPHSNAAPVDMLLSQLSHAESGNPASVDSARESGGFERIATHGWIAAPYDLAAVGDRFVYVTDVGGTMDPDGDGPEPETTRPPQLIQIDRNVAIDFDANGVDYFANQKQVAATLDTLDRPIGIAVLDGDGVNPDTLLVVVSRTPDETGRVIRIDFDPNDPANSATTMTRVVSRGQGFDEPWDVHIVSGIEPELIYVTETTAEGVSGVFAIDPRAPESTPPQPLATGAPFQAPRAIVVDPDDTNRLLVANGTGIIEVDATTGAANLFSEGPVSLWEGGYLIVDSAGDILTPVGQEILRIGSDGVAHVHAVIEDSIALSSIAIDNDGYLLVTDYGGSSAYSTWVASRLMRVSPHRSAEQPARHWCLAEEIVGANPNNTLGGVGFFSISRPRDLIFDSDGSFVLDQSGYDHSPGIGFLNSNTFLRYSWDGFTSEWFGDWLEFDPFEVHTEHLETFLNGNLAIAQNYDILSARELVYGDGQGILRHDPLPPTYIHGEPPHEWNATRIPSSKGLNFPFGLAVAGKPRPNPAPVDSDEDGVPDLEDNCVLHKNPDQEEGNQGFGVACDTQCYEPPCAVQCDANGDGVVGIPDFTLLVQQLGNNCGSLSNDPECSADCNGDGIVGIPDFSLLVSQFGATSSQVAGPKGALLDQDPACP